MDSILKLVYPFKVNEIDGSPRYLLNGVHPAVTDLIIERLKQNPLDTVESIVNEIGADNDNSWDTFFRHSNFLSYYRQHYRYENIVDLDQIIDDQSTYIWVIEIGGSLDDFYTPKKLKINGSLLEYGFIDTVPEKLLPHLRSGKVKIVINIIHDPICLPDNIMKIEKYFSDHLIDASNITIIGGNDYSNYYKDNPNSKINLTYGYIMVQQAGDRLGNFPYTSSLGYESDAVRESDLDSSIIRPKRFLCWNRTMRIQRVWLAYIALKYNLLENSYFSFLNPSGGGIRTLLVTIKELNPNDAVQYAERVQKLIPYDLDTHHLTPAQKMGFPTNNNKKEFYQNSYVHITSETLFDKNPGAPFFSEKTFHAMVNLQPFIYVGNYQALALLKSWGIRTFHPFIDESYDEEIDPVLRFKMIEKEIVKLNEMPLQQLHDWYYSITDILIHNQKILTQFKNMNPFENSLEFIRKRYGN